MKDYKEKKRQRLLAEGLLPLCACGCGNHVNLDSSHNPCKFLNGHASRWKNSVDLKKLRKILLTLKLNEGLTLSQLANKIGVSRGHLNSLLYDKRRSGVSKQLARELLARAYEVPAPISTYQSKEIKKRFKINGDRRTQGLLAYQPDLPV